MERQIAQKIEEVEAVRPVSARKAQVLLAVFLALAVSFFGLGNAHAAGQNTRPASTEAAEREFFNLLNAQRGGAGKAALIYDANLTRDARAWSAVMAPTNSIFHTKSLGDDTARSMPGWKRAGENVGRGWDVAGLHRAFVNSPGHYANIVGDFTHVGVGVVYVADRTYVTFRFAKGPVAQGSTPAQAGVGALAAPKVDTAVAQGQVRRLYLAFFLREADAEGHNYWVSVYRGGNNLGVIAGGFINSEEFRSQYGSLNNSEFVSLVYQNVMNRDADHSGHEYWVGKMNQGLSRGDVMVNFSESAEFIAKTS